MMNDLQFILFISISFFYRLCLLVSFADSSGETHKRSKSILKNKSDARLGSDPESERLLSDTGSGVSDISVIPVSASN
jgi:hypothetical protein